jgi:hypothetical protein
MPAKTMVLAISQCGRAAYRKGVEIREADDEIVLACVTLERPDFPLGDHDLAAA